MTGDGAIRRLGPDPSDQPLDDEALARAYGADDLDRAYLRVNFVTGLDGAVELHGYSAGLSNEADKRVFGLLRMLCDGLVVGAGTLRHEGYNAVRLDEARRHWRAAHGLDAYPRLVVVSARLDLDPAHAVFAEAPVRPVVLTNAASPADRREALGQVADVLVHGDTEVDLAAAVADLRRRGLPRLLCEGGPHLFGALTAADQVDELCLTLSPLLTGPGAGRITAGPTSPVRNLTLAHVLEAQGTLLLRYTRG